MTAAKKNHILPRERWTEQQSEHSKMPLLIEAHEGFETPQSPHEDRGCCFILGEAGGGWDKKILFLPNISPSRRAPALQKRLLIVY